MTLGLTRKQFETIRMQGHRIAARDVIFNFVEPAIESQERRGPRIGFSVSGRTGSSVVRSRFRRLFREAVRQSFAERNVWIQVIPKRDRRWVSPVQMNFKWSQQECQVLKDHLTNFTSSHVH